ncbi:MAG: bifunctional adenosylcobinamide kinase/adenosylcobinamide-phosphate guanylyltransferase [Bacillota bacterium]|nr:bifunctional adenosylcobinamide kinase/adenosylcobinamide-phosphate guanylyltransferase [Bacillota bacterium]
MNDKLEGKQRGLLMLITGGVRSGKSSFAEKIAAESGRELIYLATARVEDEEMRERVACHRSRRPAELQTIEEPLEPHRILEKEGEGGRLVLVDCLTILISNRLLADIDRHGAVREGEDIFVDEKMLDEAAERTFEYIKVFSAAARSCPADVVVVTNEVGMGVVPAYPLGRVFRDLSGRANQVLAAASDRVWMVVCGIPQQIK